MLPCRPGLHMLGLFRRETLGGEHMSSYNHIPRDPDLVTVNWHLRDTCTDENPFPGLFLFGSRVLVPAPIPGMEITQIRWV